MGKPQRRFGTEFEAEAARLVETGGRTQRAIAEDRNGADRPAVRFDRYEDYRAVHHHDRQRHAANAGPDQSLPRAAAGDAIGTGPTTRLPQA